jgi:hypothetical protein
MKCDGRSHRGGQVLKTIGVIDALGRRGMNNRAYCLLLTEESIFLIRERITNGVIPGVFGYTMTQARVHFHPEDEELTKLTENKDTVIIPYERLKRVWIVKGFSSTTMRREYKVAIEYMDSSMTPRKFLAVIVPPSAHNTHGRGAKTNRATAIRAGAMEAKELFKRALPDNVGIIAEYAL